MKKTAVSALVTIITLGASVASLPTEALAQVGAQTYYPQYQNQYQTTAPTYNYPTYQQPYSGSCASLSRDLSYGMRGTDVRQLQTFLVALRYPGTGNWMLTGYFGKATQATVQVFQQQNGLPVSGWVDANTRAAISRMSCGVAYPPSYPTYPPTYPPQNCNQYPYNNNYSNSTYPYLPTGQGGNNYNNTNCCPPTVQPQIYPSPYAQGYGGTQYNFNNGTYPYNQNCYGNVRIDSLSTYSGMPGQSVTIYGSGFDTYNNNVYFDGHTLLNISSYNGTSLVFTVPQTQGNTSAQVYVVSSRGTSNAMNFTVSTTNNNGCGTYPYTTNCCNNNSYPYNNNCCNNNYPYNSNGCAAPTITSVNGPTSLAVNTQGTWSLQVNNPNSSSYLTTSVNWGDNNYGYTNAAAPQTSYVTGTQALTFTHTYYTAGTYTVTFTVSNSSGQQNTSSVTVVVGGSTYNSVTLNSVSPNSGRVGTQVVLYGSGFTSQDNVVHFGVGGLKYVSSSNNGTQILYTIPYNVSPCDVLTNGSYCAQYIQQVNPGTYQIYVTNSNGTSQTVNFQVN